MYIYRCIYIHIYYLVKLAVLLVLIGGVSHTDSNGMKVLDYR